MTMHPYLQVFLAMAGAVVSVCAVVVAVMQWKLASSKLRWDLFEKRLIAKDAIHGLEDSYINSSSHPKSEAWEKFYRKAYCARGMFPRPARSWIEEVYRQFHRVWFVLEPDLDHQNKSPAPDDARRDRISGELQGFYRFAGDVYKQADKFLDKYLTV